MMQLSSSSSSCTSLMAPLVLLALILAMAGGSDGAWCVCRQDVSSAALQKSLDYACGAGADCSPILQNGPCFNPNTVVAHCSYAANSYYQRKGQTQQACDFSGTAQLVSSDPSQSGCTYPATPSAAGTSGTPSNSPATPGSSPLTPGSSSTGGLTPNSPPTTGTGTGTGTGGAFGSLGPSGTGFDGSSANKVMVVVVGSGSSSLLLLTLLLSAALALLGA